MTANAEETLKPIIRDRPGRVEPIPAAIAAITGQPLTVVVRMLGRCVGDLKGLAGVGGKVLPEDAAHAALLRFGFEPRRLFADAQRPRGLGQVLRAYLGSPNSCEMLFAICQSGRAYAVHGLEASCWANSDMRDVLALERSGTMDPAASVRFAATVKRERFVPIEMPDHEFLQAVAGPAFALAEAYCIGVTALEWPYWSVTFPADMVDVEVEPTDTLVCGEHELLSVVSGRVRSHEEAREATAALIGQLRGGPGRGEGAG